MPNERNVANYVGRILFGTIVVLSAVAGVILLFGGMGGISIPYAEGFGGNQNPLVGIHNVRTFFTNSMLHSVMRFLGVVMLLISFVGIGVWRVAEPKRQKAIRIYVVVSVVLIGLIVVDMWPSSSTEKKVDPFAEMRYDQAHFSVMYEDFNAQWQKYRKPHAPGPFTEFYKSGEIGVEGQYDLYGQMGGQWTRFWTNGDFWWQASFVGGEIQGKITCNNRGGSSCGY